jgi:hypothetical protein
LAIANREINTLTKTRFIYTEYNNRELYEGQANLKQLMKHLRDFKILIRYPDDVLLARKRNLKPDRTLIKPNTK